MRLGLLAGSWFVLATPDDLVFGDRPCNSNSFWATMTEHEHFIRVRQILLREWDPLFVTKRSHHDEEQEGEYDGYARELAKMLVRGTSPSEVLEYLKWAETQNMGLSFSEAKAKHAAELITQAV